jgi:hypothetical protein
MSLKEETRHLTWALAETGSPLLLEDSWKQKRCQNQFYEKTQPGTACLSQVEAEETHKISQTAVFGRKRTEVGT